MDSFIEVLKARTYFFDDGIAFECQQCGICCTGEPGIIYVEEREITDIAAFLDIPREIFIERCLYPFQDSYSIREAPDGRCLFYENGCAIYPVRPSQCRTYPFWFQNLRSEQSWEEVRLKCPGIGKGPTYPKEAILDCIGSSFHLYEVALKELMET